MAEITQTMGRENIQRLMKDVRSLYKTPLEDNGIFYRHDEDNITMGYAMIIGPENTPYANGFYHFTFHFPHDYPYNPPRVEFTSTRYKCRFHPNLYRSGKVCLSILNTWRGEPWTSCQTISSVLLHLCTILTENPLINEPGILLTNSSVKPYNEIITYMNLRFAITDCLIDSHALAPCFARFENMRIKYFQQKKDEIITFINSQLIRHPEPCEIRISIYNMNICIDYKGILESLEEYDSRTKRSA